jgi:ribonucleoside-diphosphate reductase alpha chain
MFDHLDEMVCKHGDNRRKLPNDRASITRKINMSGYEIYVIVGLYKDGTPGEMFIRTAKAGSTVRGLMEALAIMTSLALQYGVPAGVICEKMCGMRFDPMDTDSTSIVDAIFTWFRGQFVPTE